MKTLNRLKRTGYTLVELLVVVAALLCGAVGISFLCFVCWVVYKLLVHFGVV